MRRNAMKGGDIASGASGASGSQQPSGSLEQPSGSLQQQEPSGSLQQQQPSGSLQQQESSGSLQQQQSSGSLQQPYGSLEQTSGSLEQASGSQASGSLEQTSGSQASGSQDLTFSSGAQASAANAQASAARAQAFQEIQSLYNELGYITMTGPMNMPPTIPYDFKDTFIPRTESELQNMTFEQLIGYSNAISTSAGLEYSTIRGNQYVQNQYSLLILLSQSTIDGINNQITTNDAQLDALRKEEESLQKLSTMQLADIDTYTREIEEQEEIIEKATKDIDDLTAELNNVSSMTESTMSSFIGDAVRYSSLYYTYEGWKEVYTERKQTLEQYVGEPRTRAPRMESGKASVAASAAASGAASGMASGTASAAESGTASAAASGTAYAAESATASAAALDVFDVASGAESGAESGAASGAMMGGAVVDEYEADSLVYGEGDGPAGTILGDAVIRERSAFQTLRDTTAIFEGWESTISSLYTESNDIQARLTQNLLDKAVADRDYLSTQNAISTLKKDYDAAIANQNYAYALSTKTQLVNIYGNALSTFNDVDVAYSATVPPQGGGAKKGGALSASGPVLGDSALWAARSMAYSKLQTATANKDEAIATTEQLKSLAEVAYTDAYDALITQLENNVRDANVMVKKMRGYKVSSLESVARFSSLYDQAEIDVAEADRLAKLYSTYYISSLIGASTLHGLYDEDERQIRRDTDEADAISHGISTLRDDYDMYMSSYNGYMYISSILKAQAEEAEAIRSTYASYYDSSMRAADDLRSRIRNIDTQIFTNDAILFSQSSILNSELINLAGFDATLKTSLNDQEAASYMYRESFCREKRLAIQTNYEVLVLGAVQQASTMTGQQRALAPNAIINPIPVDLTQPAIQSVYQKLSNLNTFLTNMTNIYSAYDTQTDNLTNLSTSIGVKDSTYSTLKWYAEKAYYTSTMDMDLKRHVAQAEFSGTQNNYNTVLGAYAAQQGTIAAAKETFSTTYVTFFTPAEIYTHNTTISSFILQGYSDAQAILQSQGITYII